MWLTYPQLCPDIKSLPSSNTDVKTLPPTHCQFTSRQMARHAQNIPHCCSSSSLEASVMRSSDHRWRSSSKRPTHTHRCFQPMAISVHPTFEKCCRHYASQILADSPKKFDLMDNRCVHMSETSYVLPS